VQIHDQGHFHTPEQVRDHTRETLAIADELGLEGEDRAALLPGILTLLAGKQVVFNAGAAAMVAMPGQHLG
jgi:hypothetical protein